MRLGIWSGSNRRLEDQTLVRLIQRNEFSRLAHKQPSRQRAAALRADVLRGLAPSPRTLPSKYLYDARGSRLFDKICTLPEH